MTPQTSSGKLFTVLFAAVGVTIVFSGLGFMTSRIIETESDKAFELARLAKQKSDPEDQITNHKGKNIFSCRSEIKLGYVLRVWLYITLYLIYYTCNILCVCNVQTKNAFLGVYSLAS